MTVAQATSGVVVCIPGVGVVVVVRIPVVEVVGIGIVESLVLIRHKFLLFRDDGWGREGVVKRRYNMVWFSVSNQYQTTATSPANSPRATRAWTLVETAAPATNLFSQLRPGS